MLSAFTCDQIFKAFYAHNFVSLYPPISLCLYSCNGKNSCTIKASNSVFGDPCIRTYKYLELAYNCECK